MSAPHILLYEPRTEGHHPGWLRFITEDFLSGGFKLTLAVDGRPRQAARIREHLGELVSKVTLLDIGQIAGNARGIGQKISTVAKCLKASGADRVFLCALDEVASHLWRAATFGISPPEELRGKMGGIYHRPRFMEMPVTSPHRWFKWRGFGRLLREKWFCQILFVDEYLAQRLKAAHPGAPVSFLCDPCPAATEMSVSFSREKLNIPAEAKVFLFYGGGYRRKGLHLAVDALLRLPPQTPAYLLCAGQLDPHGETARGIARLVSENRAQILNRYVTAEEERLCFAACDAVLLPYIHHFGTSGVLSRAMASSRMVIVSDEELLGRLTREHGLGMLFPSQDVAALSECLRLACEMSSTESAAFQVSAKSYALKYSRDSYRRSLLAAMSENSPAIH